MDSTDIELLKLLSAIADKESDRIWVRYNAMLVSSTGLIAVFGWLIGQDQHTKQLSLAYAILFLSAIGAALAVTWLLTIVLGRFYEKRWFADMDAIIQGDQSLRRILLARNGASPRVVRPRLPNVLVLFCSIPAAFLSFWVWALVASLLLVLR